MNKLSPLNRRAGLTAIAAVAGVFILMAALIASSRYINLELSTPVVMWLYRVSLAVTILGAVLFAVLFFALTYIGVRDREEDRELSRLYPSVVAKAAFLFAFFILASVGAIDSLIHGLVPRWNLALQPEIRLAYSLLYLGVIGGFAWFLGTILHGRGLRTAAIIMAYACIVAAAALVILLAFAVWG